MTIQTIEIHGERYVIVSERDFQALSARPESTQAPDAQPQNGHHHFRDVVPLPASGTPASEILLRDRR